MAKATEAEVKTLSLHEQAIADLRDLNPSFQTNGFWGASRALWDRLIVSYDEYDEGFPKMHWIPDLWCIDLANERLIVIEVEDRWPLNRHKRREFGEFWYRWDCMTFGWDVWFMMANRFGALTHRLEGSDLFLEGMLQQKHDAKNPPKNNRYREKFG